MMVAIYYDKTIDVTIPARKNADGQNSTGYINEVPTYFARPGNDSFTTHAVSASGLASFLPPMTYMQHIEQWAREFQYRKHTLSQEEIEALNSQIYLDLLETQNSLD